MTHAAVEEAKWARGRGVAGSLGLGEGRPLSKLWARFCLSGPVLTFLSPLTLQTLVIGEGGGSGDCADNIELGLCLITELEPMAAVDYSTAERIQAELCLLMPTQIIIVKAKIIINHSVPAGAEEKTANKANSLRLSEESSIKYLPTCNSFVIMFPLLFLLRVE